MNENRKNITTSTTIITDRVDFYTYQTIQIATVGPVIDLLPAAYMPNNTVPSGKALIDITLYPSFQGVDRLLNGATSPAYTYTPLTPYMIRDYQGITWRVLTKSNLTSVLDGDAMEYINITPIDKNFKVPLEKILWSGQQLRMKIDLTGAFPGVTVPTNHTYFIDFLMRVNGRIVNDTEAKNLQYKSVFPYGEEEIK